MKLIEFTYQHTCNSGNEAYILQNGPFKASSKKLRNGKIKVPFLGSGYYLWEENIRQAHDWGMSHYRKNYCIIQFANLKIDIDEVMDLTNRRHLNYFIELVSDWTMRYPERAKWGVGQWIDFFKSLHKLDNKTFPYNYVRAEENLPDPKENGIVKQKIKFSVFENHYMYLNPLIIVCVIDKSKMVYKSKEYINKKG